MLELYKRIWKVTGRDQLLLIVLSLTIAGLAAVPLQFQKDIINGLNETMEVPKLLTLCAGYFLVLLLSSALKFLMRYKSSVLSESVICRIRKVVYSDKAKGDVSGGDDRGTLVTKIAAEAEEVGRFVGDSISLPLLQLGTLGSVVAYVAATQPFLGIFIVGVVLPQAVIVLTLQKHVNVRVAKRVRTLRHATNSLTVEDIDQVEQAIFADFDEIYETRREIFKLKLSMKFALNVINGLGTVGILTLGGLLFLHGKTDIGSVVAALSALTRIAQPWVDLVAFYRELSAVRVKFELLELA